MMSILQYTRQCDSIWTRREQMTGSTGQHRQQNENENRTEKQNQLQRYGKSQIPLVSVARHSDELNKDDGRPGFQSK